MTEVTVVLSREDWLDIDEGKLSVKIKLTDDRCLLVGAEESGREVNPAFLAKMADERVLLNPRQMQELLRAGAVVSVVSQPSELRVRIVSSSGED